VKIDIVAVPDLTHQVYFATALAQGLRAHGIEPRILCAGDTPQTEIVACWGWRVGSALRAAGHRVLVGERGYIGDRFARTSLAWNGLNGRVFAPAGDRQRFAQHFPAALRPWRPDGEYALIVGQVPGDAALLGRDLQGWYECMARAFPVPARFRSHPDAGGAAVVDGAERLIGSLEDALSRARVVVTWNSNVGVDAVLAGKPTIAFDCGSMAWPVAAHHAYIVDVEPDRERWAAELAWRQWTANELRNGTAWAHVRQAIDLVEAAA
jgi:hypothetical protein